LTQPPFGFHPQFNQPGTRGFGKFYTLTDASNTGPKPDFTPGVGTRDEGRQSEALIQLADENQPSVRRDPVP
jgi:hypothetical protein